MRVFTLRREQLLPGTPAEVFPFFADARNLEAITPPLLRFEVVTPGEIPLRVGALIQYRLKLHGVSLNWLTSIQEWDPPHRFVDQQVRGPYALWHHTHDFRAGAGRPGRDADGRHRPLRDRLRAAGRARGARVRAPRRGEDLRLPARGRGRGPTPRRRTRARRR
jgi:hypothetical protein